MSGTPRRAEFFSREAGDCLRQLEPLLGEGTAPLDALIRLARGLRGAAMLAGPASFARAASELERVIRLLREGRIGWEKLAPGLRGPVGAFRRLATAAPTWAAAQDHEADRLLTDLRSLAGPSGAGGAAAGPAGEAAARGYVARETATVAGALERAARTAMETGTAPQDRLADLRRAMQSLRGLAAVADFPPLPEVLEAVDATAADLSRCPAPAAHVAELLGLAAEALSGLARAVASAETPDPERVAARLAQRLFDLLVSRTAVVPVESLLEAGATESPAGGARRATPLTAAELDLVTLGEALRQGAASLRTAPSRVARRLRTFTLIGTLRSAPGGLGHQPAGTLLGRLLSALEAEGGNAPVEPLSEILDQAGRLLSTGTRADLVGLAGRLGVLAERIPASTRVESATRPEQEGLAEPIPIGALAPDAPSGTAAGLTALERTLGTYQRLARSGAPAAPLEALLAPAATLAPPGAEVVPIERLLAPLDTEEVPIEALLKGELPGVVPIEELLAREEPDVVPIEALLVEDEAGVVPVEDLLYRGRGALERADEVRRELESALRSASTELERLEPLLRELLDLVPLALVEPC